MDRRTPVQFGDDRCYREYGGEAFKIWRDSTGDVIESVLGSSDEILKVSKVGECWIRGGWSSSDESHVAVRSPVDVVEAEADDRCTSTDG